MSSHIESKDGRRILKAVLVMSVFQCLIFWAVLYMLTGAAPEAKANTAMAAANATHQNRPTVPVPPPPVQDDEKTNDEVGIPRPIPAYMEFGKDGVVDVWKSPQGKLIARVMHIQGPGKVKILKTFNVVKFKQTKFNQLEIDTGKSTVVFHKEGVYKETRVDERPSYGMTLKHRVETSEWATLNNGQLNKTQHEVLQIRKYLFGTVKSRNITRIMPDGARIVLRDTQFTFGTRTYSYSSVYVNTGKEWATFNFLRQPTIKRTKTGVMNYLKGPIRPSPDAPQGGILHIDMTKDYVDAWIEGGRY